MSGRGRPHKVRKAMVQPITIIFKFLQSKSTVEIMLYENIKTRLQGKLIGFDEFMNVVLDDAVEVGIKDKSRRELGRLMLKGDNITMIRGV